MSTEVIEPGPHARRLVDEVICPGCGEVQGVVEHGLYGRIAHHLIKGRVRNSPLVRTTTSDYRLIVAVYECPASLANIELGP